MTFDLLKIFPFSLVKEKISASSNFALNIIEIKSKSSIYNQIKLGYHLLTKAYAHKDEPYHFFGCYQARIPGSPLSLSLK